MFGVSVPLIGVFVVLSTVQDVIVKLVRSEGLLSLWKGFTPYYARLGPHTVLIFIFLEKLKYGYYNYVVLPRTQPDSSPF